MKNKILAILSILVFLSFFSCTNVLEERSESTSKEVSVSFNFGSSRTIVSSAEAEKYSYTLKGTLSGETKTFCEKLAYSSFITKAFDVKKGEWTFEITAYNNDKPVYSDSKTVKLTTPENTVSFVLRAVTGGNGSVSVKLKYPANKGVSKVTASFYDDIAGSDSGTALTLNESDSSTTFSSDAVPSGVNKLIKFYLYDSQNVCIGSYVENVFIANGDSLSVERTLENVNTFAVTVYLTSNNQPWNNSGYILKAANSKGSYNLHTTTGTNTYTASLPLGNYDIYNEEEDTGVNLEVLFDGTGNATVNYNLFIVPAENAVSLISSLTEDASIILTGSLNENLINEIGNAIKQSIYNVQLDLTQTNGLVTIPFRAFYNCEKLTEIKMPNSITEIMFGAFQKCKALKNIEIPSSVTQIGEHAFASCSNLVSVKFPEESEVSLGRYAFRECSSLTSVTIPSSVKNIGICVFGICNNLTEIIVDETNQDFVSVDGILYNKDKSTLICYPSGKGGASFTIPSTVTRIEEYAFQGGQYLSELIVPSTVIDIPQNAFYGCPSLTSVTLPSDITSIGRRWFVDCTKLKSVTIPSTVTKICEWAFYNCEELTAVTIPSTVTEIEECAFYGCKNITSLKIPASVESIGVGCFSHCWKIEKFLVEDSNPFFASEDGVLFNKSKNLIICYPAGKNNSIYTIPDTVTTIGNYAFGYMEESKLRSVIIPLSVHIIEGSAFSKNTCITTIQIPNSVNYIDGYVFRECTSLSTIYLPSSISDIGFKAFFACEKLETINYTGSEAQWSSITKGEQWNEGCPSTMVINYNYQE